MNEKVCLLTGATGGIGRATAHALAAAGATALVVSRDAQRGEGLRRELAAATGNERAEALVADLSTLRSIRELASQVVTRHNRLDVLIHNAAIFTRHREATPDGLEAMFATNHLGPFSLTRLLEGLLRQSAPSRVLVVTAPSTVPLDFDDLQSERSFSPLRAFGASKMCNLLFSYELARRLEGSGVTVNAVHPGVVRSNLMRQAPWFIRALTRLSGSPPEKAAAWIAHLALAPELESVTGGFFKDGRPIASNAYSHDPAVQRRLWEVSVTLAPA